MIEKKLTGNIRFREYPRVVGRPLVVLQFEERVIRQHKETAYTPRYESNVVQFRDATPAEAGILRHVDPDKPFMEEVRRVIGERYGARETV